MLSIWRMLSLLPMRAHWILGLAIGEILHLVLRKRRDVALKNLATCFPDRDDIWYRRTLRRHLWRAGRAILGTGLGAWGRPERVARLTSLHGLERVRSLLESGQPVILLAPHMVDVMFLALSLSHQLPMVAMYKRPRSDTFHSIYRRVCNGESTGDVLLDRLSGNRREQMLQVVEHRQSSLHIVVRAMRKFSAFLYLPDQDLGRRQAVFAPFFGVEAISSTALFRFTELGSAVVVPVYVCHQPMGGGYDIYFEEPIENMPTGDDVSDAARINTVMEGIIRRYPEHYFWLHKRFKTRPKGETPFYG